MDVETYSVEVIDSINGTWRGLFETFRTIAQAEEYGRKVYREYLTPIREWRIVRLPDGKVFRLYPLR